MLSKNDKAIWYDVYHAGKYWYNYLFNGKEVQIGEFGEDGYSTLLYGDARDFILEMEDASSVEEKETVVKRWLGY